MTLATTRPLSEGEVDSQPKLNFAWLEITGKCQLKCLHCYAESGPNGSHGSMTPLQWRAVIDQVAELGAPLVQFIGGEPTLHPDFIALARYALSKGLAVEVYTNLVLVNDALWELFATPGVQLATSYYSDDPQQHGRITGAANSHRLTTANIEQAVRRGIPLRVGLIDIEDGQRADAARALLKQMGVTEIGYDRLREVGRGQRQQTADTSQLCGQCTNNSVAIAPDGTVWPCVFTRWLPVGNVQDSPLATILTGSVMSSVAEALDAEFAQRMSCEHGDRGCNPRCGPTVCSPDYCKPKIGVHSPTAGCAPADCGPNCPPNCSPQCGPTQCSPKGTR